MMPLVFIDALKDLSDLEQLRDRMRFSLALNCERSGDRRIVCVFSMIGCDFSNGQ